MQYFVAKDSIVRKIWGTADTVLLIFAGASAEFALNKAVDWLYFTGKLPSDPLGRLFSTVTYARQIVFSEYDDAMRAIEKITLIHQGVEQNRGAKIPDWASRDVLFMLIDYSIRSFEVLERKLTLQEKEEVFQVFNRMGLGMKIAGLPESYNEWMSMRENHLKADLIKSNFTKDLYRQYKKHLGLFRYILLKQAQNLIVPRHVNKLLQLGNLPLLKPMLEVYKFTRLLKLEGLLKDAILPAKHKQQIAELDVNFK